MANTINLQSTLLWCQPFIKFQPMTVAGNEPALTCANMVIQTILGPPFCWRWNRKSANFNCVADGTQDYAVAAPDFGFIEKAWLADGATSIYEVSNKVCLGRTLEKARPSYIAAQSDDGAGNISFRLLAAPDKAYAATVLYQLKAPLMSSLASVWAPIPDEFSYIFHWGFLTFAAILLDDPRFPIFNQKFLAHLLGAAEGLDEMQKNLFLGNWLELVKAFERAQAKTQQGIAARAQ